MDPERFTPDGAELYQSPSSSSPEKTRTWNPREWINRIGLAAALIAGPIMMNPNRVEAAQASPKQAGSTERMNNGAEQIATVSEYLTEPMFMKACTEEGSVQVLKDLYGGYVKSEKQAEGQTATYNREITPEASMKLLNTRIGEIINDTDADITQYEEADTKAYAADLYHRIQERYGKTPNAEILTRYYNKIQKNLFPNGFADEPAILIGAKDKTLVPAYMLTNHEVLGIISATMVESGVDQMIMKEKNLNRRSELVKIAIDNAMGLVTQGAIKGFIETGFSPKK